MQTPSQTRPFEVPASVRRADRVKTVLLVDDEPLITEIVAARLRGAGLEVVVSRNGLEALDTLANGKPDLVITDVHMPLMGGIELSATLASDVSTSSIPVLLLTAAGSEFDSATTPNIRATIRKPFAAEEIVTRSVGILTQNASVSRG